MPDMRLHATMMFMALSFTGYHYYIHILNNDLYSFTSAILRVLPPFVGFFALVLTSQGTVYGITDEYRFCMLVNWFANIAGTFICTWTHYGYVCYIVGRIAFAVGVWQLFASQWSHEVPSQSWCYMVLTGVCYVLADVAEVWLDDGSMWGTLMMNVATVQIVATVVK